MLPWQRTVLFLLVAGALVELGMLGASHKRARVRLHPDHPDPVRASAAQAADFAAHARTLGVAGALYVANLPRRTDRRANMSALADHLGADVRFVDAVDARGPEVAHILEHVRALRESGAAYPEKFAFPARSAPLDWTRALPPGTTVNTSVQLYSNNDEANTPTWDGTGQEPTRLREGAIACWETHLRMLRRIAAAAASAPGRGRPSAAASTGIIFEDDIDTEVDIRARLEGLWPALPPAWDMVFLGWCFSNEWEHDAIAEYTPPGTYQTSSLRPANSPLCTHAYAVSASGARRLLAHLEYPPFAYSRDIDQAYKWLTQTGRISTFSVVPPVAIQRRMDQSDISTGWVPWWWEELYKGVLG